MNYHTPQIVEIATTIIAAQIGMEPTSVELISDLEEDLGLLDQDVQQVLAALNLQYEELHLTLDDLRTNEVHTVGDLIQLMDEELAYA